MKRSGSMYIHAKFPDKLKASQPWAGEHTLEHSYVPEWNDVKVFFFFFFLTTDNWQLCVRMCFLSIFGAHISFLMQRVWSCHDSQHTYIFIVVSLSKLTSHQSSEKKKTHTHIYTYIKVIRAMLSVIRESLKDEETSFIYLGTESCVPITSFTTLANRLFSEVGRLLFYSCWCPNTPHTYSKIKIKRGWGENSYK
jgi:ABC-type multidrug transport system fused ATPase/permease subunit